MGLVSHENCLVNLRQSIQSFAAFCESIFILAVTMAY